MTGVIAFDYGRHQNVAHRDRAADDERAGPQSDGATCRTDYDAERQERHCGQHGAFDAEAFGGPVHHRGDNGEREDGQRAEQTLHRRVEMFGRPYPWQQRADGCEWGSQIQRDDEDQRGQYRCGESRCRRWDVMMFCYLFHDD
nr:hypothetical protein [Bifidobacterium vansinderenii]